MRTMRRVIRLAPGDPVVVLREAGFPGDPLAGETVRLREAVPAGHKVATAPVPRGAPVRKYGQIIGVATRDILPGDHVHTHNLAPGDLAREAEIGREATPLPPAGEIRTFRGYRRPDGRVGTRNWLGVIATVNCAATVAHMVRERFSADELRAHPTVDGIVAIAHPGGCGTALDGEGFRILRRTLLGLLRHPNFAGVLLVGLGCEVAQIRFLLEAAGLEEGPRLRTLVMQECGGTRRTVARAVDMLREMLPEAGRARREEVPAAELVLALQCGGSDAWSGVTANPALGVAADLLVRQGGTVILSETPEIYGAEHLLARRAVSREVGERLLARIRWWEAYVARHGGTMDHNPTPGNRAGGLTTILEKSLGAVAKAGTAPLVDVLEYAEPVRRRGLVFMDSPGYDPCSVTGQMASGATVVAFTTGRGSCFGSKPAPTLKIASNGDTFRRMEEDMDLNAGLVLDGETTVEEMGRRIFERILALASGEPSKSERLGVGDHEFVPWQIGAVM